MEVKGYPNYLIYPDGRVWSKKSNKFLIPIIVGKGYHSVKLGNLSKQFQVHRLVATHYIPNPDNKSQVDHINRIKTDNRVENLRWVTQNENMMNRGILKNNKLGYKNISYCKKNKNYEYKKTINGVRYFKKFKTLKEALCYKYIFTLKMRAGLV